jgi:anti-sigma factor RsiW
MTNDIHARARELMLDGAAGLLSTAETTELMRHLAECEACRAEQDELSSSVSVFKKASAVTAPPFLAARTRAGVRFRAEQLTGSDQRRRVISIALIFDIAWTFLSIWLMFNAAQWFGFATASSWVWIVAISWFWLLPGLGALMVVSMRNANLIQWLGAEGVSRD